MFPNHDFQLSRRRFGAILVAGMLGAGLVSPAFAADPVVLTTRIGSDIGNLDPARIFQIENQTVATQIYNGLVKYDEATNEIVPDLAKSWEVSEDGTTYTFHLNDGVTFHKGYGPMTSDDVKFSFERVLDPETGSNYKGQFAAIDTIETPDPMTVVITLKAPNSGFLHKVAAFNQGWIVSRKALADIGKDQYLTNPIGTGPFVFEKWTPGREVRLVANKDYFEGAPKVDELLFRLIKDETAAAVALENGEIDIFFGLQEPAVISRLQASDKVTVLDRDANHTINLVLNTTNKPLDDLKVRQAIIHALNRKGLIEGFFKGTKSEAASVLTPSFQEFTDDVATYAYDPEKAKALLEEAGATGAEIELVAPAFNPYDKVVVALAADLEAVGFKPKITVLERGAYLQARNKGEVDTVITGVVGAPDPDSPILSMLSRSAFPPGLNTAHYEGIEDLIQAAGTATSTEERKKVYAEMQKKVAEDLPVVPLFTDHLFIAHTNKVKGFTQNSLFTMSAYPVSIEE
ncbi:ABC transporter substrate-binding protein [Rhodobium gokarnense]|uniref:Peptide/nickel transport system substrate-binding protein n=1 Tax=Rhodobium gokarnense TaxID=364296 RepID=A0ABT3H661_9HYPH|nr:ABC transporter substrate-binding protein [Rhodobium gokarnense]MCW2305875.1 peptide/nickel transport system substrate-binding protein [Rhodobium gokarnense]